MRPTPARRGGSASASPSSARPSDARQQNRRRTDPDQLVGPVSSAGSRSSDRGRTHGSGSSSLVEGRRTSTRRSRPIRRSSTSTSAQDALQRRRRPRSRSPTGSRTRSARAGRAARATRATYSTSVSRRAAEALSTGRWSGWRAPPTRLREAATRSTPSPPAAPAPPNSTCARGLTEVATGVVHVHERGLPDTAGVPTSTR